MESGIFEPLDQVEIQMDIVGCVESEHVEMVEISPVVPRGWRRIRWLKRRGIDAVCLGVGPSLGGASRNVGCGNLQGWNFEKVFEHVGGDVGADVLVDGRCDGHGWCHKRIDIGHGARLGFEGLVAVCFVMSCRLSSRLSICPPLVRPAPGIFSFPSCSIPPPPTHSAVDDDDVGVRYCFVIGGGFAPRPLLAGASVARTCSSVSSFGVGSPASFDDLHPAGSRRLSSFSVVSSCCSVRFRQGKCCSVSAQSGRGVVAASLGTPGVALTQSSNKVILGRPVTIVDLGLAGSCVATDGGLVVGSVSGRQPQQLPSSSHCVLRLRGGASSTTSSDDDGAATAFAHHGGVDVSSAGSVNEAVGSGVGGGRCSLNDDGSGTVRRVLAGVLARGGRTWCWTCPSCSHIWPHCGTRGVV